MKHFFIITNENKDKGLKLTKRMQSYIQEKGGVCAYGLNRVQTAKGMQNIQAESIPTDTECIFCIGGDGTLIRAARDMAGLKIPLMGVNQGHVGYLCEIDSDTVFSKIDLLMENSYLTEKRMMLNGCNARGENFTALNDIVIHRCGLLQTIQMKVCVNGENLKTYRADGIIIATPTGSTAYNMSAGGPIVDPKAELMLITPISPHELNAKSIVLGADSEIVIEIVSRMGEEKEVAAVSFDGDLCFYLEEGEKIIIKKATESTQILKLSKRSFLEILSKKMRDYS